MLKNNKNMAYYIKPHDFNIHPLSAFKNFIHLKKVKENKICEVKALK